MGVGDTFSFYGYSSDNGHTYAIKLSTLVATQGGFGSTVDPNTTPPFPYGPKNVRHVWGKSSTGKRTRLPISTASFGLYVSGGTFTLGAGSYDVEGAIGEARKLNSVA
jgi:hypothetical protein